VIRRGVVTVLASAAALLALGAVLPGFNVADFRAAVLVSFVCGAFNVVIWPLVVRLALPITVLTLGLPVLALNGAVVVLAAWIVPGVEVRDVFTGIVVTFGITAATTVTGAVLAIDETRVRRHLLRRAPRQRTTDVPGVLFLEIDGLAHEVLVRALRDGNAPTLARWLREGSHALRGWETDWSSQTGACQAGLLHGSNADIPAFRWWEKEHGRTIVTNHPRDAAEIEQRISDGRGLLHDDGASRANILSGDAPHSLLTMSTVLEVRRRGQRLGQDYAAYFSSPYNLSRTVLATIVHMARELRFAADQRRRDVQPRIRRTLGYAPVRAWATAIQRDLQVAAVVADAHAGRPVVYTTFLAYDEVAHHSGIERPDTLDVLRDVDRQIDRIAAASAGGPRPYEIVVLSDHGQTQGATFRQRHGYGLDELVERSLARGDVMAIEGGDEQHAMAGHALREAGGAAATPEPHKRDKADVTHRDVVVLGSGNLGLVYLMDAPHRMTLEEIDLRHPDLIGALRGHEHVGWLLVRSGVDGAMVLGPRGSMRLSDGRVQGEDPLAAFPPGAAGHLRRTDSFAHTADIMVGSFYDAERDEGCAFEELISFHGGLGGAQTRPFLMVGPRLAMPDEPITGAEAVNDVLRGWRRALQGGEVPATTGVAGPLP
jgi:uncharacterized membrane protein YvlD (DUF360 family)